MLSTRKTSLAIHCEYINIINQLKNLKIWCKIAKPLAFHMKPSTEFQIKLSVVVPFFKLVELASCYDCTASRVSSVRNGLPLG